MINESELRQPRPDCDICDGSGWDSVFDSPCACRVSGTVASGDKVSLASYAGAVVVNEAPRPQAGAPASNQYGTFKVHSLSEGQQRFIANLVAERIVPAHAAEWVAAFQAGTLNKRHASDLIDVLLAAPKQPQFMGKVGSPKQRDLVERLCGELGHNMDEILAECSTPKHVSNVIDRLIAESKAAKQAKADATPELEAGMYRVADGRIYKVYRAVHGSGKMVAKLLVVGEYGEKATFEYQGLATRFVKAEHRMTLEQAKEFGALYGVCAVCGATLTDEGSIEAGIGPICKGKV